MWDIVMKICLRTGASLAHHHGIGLARLPYMKEALGANMLIIDKMKQVLDPNNIMNPGKLRG
jgi:alkyldihydroxyacetonephosphate synthase